MTIKVLEKTPGCLPVQFEQGDWYDLRTAEEITFKAPYAKTLHHRKNEKEKATPDRIRDVVFDSVLAKLGICVEVPKGYESIIVPRSSTFKKYGLLQSNSIGVIDQTYCSGKDEWRMPLIATRAVTIPQGTRVAQFRAQLSQKATPWQKLKWFLSGAPKIKRVFYLNNPVRDGFGSTGEK